MVVITTYNLMVTTKNDTNSKRKWQDAVVVAGMATGKKCQKVWQGGKRRGKKGLDEREEEQRKKKKENKDVNPSLVHAESQIHDHYLISSSLPEYPQCSPILVDSGLLRGQHTSPVRHPPVPISRLLQFHVRVTKCVGVWRRVDEKSEWIEIAECGGVRQVPRGGAIIGEG